MPRSSVRAILSVSRSGRSHRRPRKGFYGRQRGKCVLRSDCLRRTSGDLLSNRRGRAPDSRYRRYLKDCHVTSSLWCVPSSYGGILRSGNPRLPRRWVGDSQPLDCCRSLAGRFWPIPSWNTRLVAIRDKVLPHSPLWDSHFAFIDANEIVLLIGRPGIGKSHAAKAIALSAAQRGYKVLYREARTLLVRISRKVTSDSR